MCMSRRVPGEIHRQGNEALGDLLEGKDAVEAWGALRDRRVPAGTGGRGVPAVVAWQGGRLRPVRKLRKNRSHAQRTGRTVSSPRCMDSSHFSKHDVHNSM
ncbi:hypothetical protein ACQJBY_004587 [Aegilops geniculata]